MSPFRISLLCTLAAALASGASAEDLTITYKVTQDDKPASTKTTWVSNDHIRSQSPDGNEFMMDYSTGNLTFVDGKKKEFWVATRQDMEAMAAQMQKMQAQMQEQMKNLPPAVRDKMAAQMGGLGGGIAPAVDVQKGTGGRTVAGYACENWLVTVGQLAKNEECVTTQLQFPIAAYDAMKNMSAMNPAMKSMGQMFEKFKEMKGVPVYSRQTIQIMGRSQTSVSEVTEVKKGAIPASAWQLPADYKKVESPMAKMGKR